MAVSIQMWCCENIFEISHILLKPVKHTPAATVLSPQRFAPERKNGPDSLEIRALPGAISGASMEQIREALACLLLPHGGPISSEATPELALELPSLKGLKGARAASPARLQGAPSPSTGVCNAHSG